MTGFLTYITCFKYTKSLYKIYFLLYGISSVILFTLRVNFKPKINLNNFQRTNEVNFVNILDA